MSRCFSQPNPPSSSDGPDIDAKDGQPVMPSDQVFRYLSDSRRTLTITLPPVVHVTTNAEEVRLPSPDHRKTNSGADDSSFSSLGSPSSPSQSPYFTPGVSSASSVESSTDGSDPRVRSTRIVPRPLGHIRLPTGLGLRVSDHLSLAITRTRDKGMSVDFGLERRTATQSSLPDKRKSYSPYLVNQQVACAKGCGKVTAKCVKCGAASKTKMQRSQSLAKPSFSTPHRRSMQEPSLVLYEDPEEPESVSLGEAERKRAKARLINSSHNSMPMGGPIEAEVNEEHETDASSWPPYPFRPS